MSDNGSASHVPGQSGSAWRAGAVVLALLGLAAVALGLYLWALEAGTPVEAASSGMSFRGLGYVLGLVLVALGSPPLGVGAWILRRPGSPSFRVGAGLSLVYALLMLWFGLYAVQAQRGVPMSPSTAIPFAIGGLFVLAAILLYRSLLGVQRAATEARLPPPVQPHPDP